MCIASLVLDKHELVVWFLDHGADPNAECKIGVSPFMEATSKASLEIVQLLHRHGARPGITATCAAQSSVPGRFEVLKYLLDIGTPIDAIDFEHNAIGQASIIQLGPAINHAVCNKETNTKEKEKMIELLLARGARTDIPDYFFKRTAVDLAMEYGTSKTIEMMRKYTVRRSKI
jgi:ankyrin repeat protein